MYLQAAKVKTNDNAADFSILQVKFINIKIV